MGGGIASIDWRAGLEFAGIALAAAVAITAVVLAGRVRDLGNRLRSRDRSLARSFALVAMAEELAGLGRWRARPDGVPEWSSGLSRITGFPPGMTPDFETLCEMMPDGGAAFYGALEQHKRDSRPFAFEFAARRVDGEMRTLRVVVRNEFDPATGKLVERQGVALDVTEARRREAELAREKGEAIAAAEEALRLSETDPLTGLANRRRAMAEADRGALAAAQQAEPLVLLIFDIDHFKSVNDRHGHPAGDAVLVKVAEIARRAVRTGDLVARIGGEEFLCILRGADLAVARACADRLRRAVARESGTAGVPPVTVSVGYAGWREGDAALALFARADAALYEAKASGRDCVRRAA
ncbi:diguanylate cyclase [Tsuneonella sp. SYSU-LHT278]|uniref:GGDEF domain-containing protein n=1 Tax=Tsuneonella sediminis TaxID=3416089 RepID=UPI003F79087F